MKIRRVIHKPLKETRKALIIFGMLWAAAPLFAQVERPDDRYLFEQDKKDRKVDPTAEIHKRLPQDAPPTNDLNLKAPKVEFLREKNEVVASEGMFVSREGVQLQADHGTINLDTNDADVAGDLLFTSPEGEISAESGRINMETETGTFKDADLNIEGGDYGIATTELKKVGEDQYELDSSIFSTCQCRDGSKPWAFHCSDSKIEYEGYAHTYNTRLHLYDVPVMYTPYLMIPVKFKRQSGMLAPEYGYSSEDGMKLKLPVFVVIDDSTDITISPFTETKTRTGSSFDFRKIFSQRSETEGRVIYSNESARDGDLRGTVTSGLADTTIDENRVGGFMRQQWRSESGTAVPMSMVSDIHLVSDDLMVREFEDSDIANRESRYTTSRILGQASYEDLLNAQISNEYNQALVDDDDTVFQRLPSILMSSSKSFRPFGFNPYGLKMVGTTTVTGTDFVRSEGFEGWREDVTPGLKMLYHVKNYLNGSVGVSGSFTRYDLRDETVPGDPTYEIEQDERKIGRFDYTLGSAMERVYQVEKDSWLSTLTSLGSNNQTDRLRRVKHSVEPLMRYSYISPTDQDEQRIFDSYDRLRHQSQFLYGIRNSFSGRFLPSDVAAEEIPELTPRVEDLPLVGGMDSFTDFGMVDTGQGQSAGNVNIRKGQIRDVITFDLYQSYDYIEDEKDLDPTRDAFSDIGTKLGVYPTRSFGVQMGSNYDYEGTEFSSWSLGTHLKDDRGDIIRLRYDFIDDPRAIEDQSDDAESQLEAGAEVVLAERLKVGYYSRFDDRHSEFIDHRVAFRMISACNCWYMDIGVQDRINPDKTQGFLTFTFKGLGDITQKLSMGGANSSQ